MSTHKEGFVPLKRPVAGDEPGLAQAPRLQADGVDPGSVEPAGGPGGEAQAANPGIGANRPDTGSAERGGPWSQTPEAGTAGDDLGQIRRDDRYLAALVSSVPRATGEDGRADLALAQDIHAAVEPKDIFGRWRVEDLVHTTRELERYRTQRVAQANASRFKALVFLLLPFTNDLGSLAAEITRQYFGSEGPEKRKDAISVVRGCGITDAAINAQAAELHARSIAALDRLVAQGQTRRSNIVREVKRDKRRADKAKARKSRPDRPDQPELALH
jgi:hypothetical protein